MVRAKSFKTSADTSPNMQGVNAIVDSLSDYGHVKAPNRPQPDSSMLN